MSAEPGRARGGGDPVLGDGVLGATPIAACVGLVLGMLALGPGLLPGYLLSYDMVFVPAPQFNAAMLGTAGTLPRAVPSDAVVAAIARALPADVVQKLVLLAIFVLACAGAARLLSKERMPAQLAAGVLYAWNPFVAERLILGQWALLLGYAGLPWVLAAAARPGVRVLRRVPRLAIALLPAAVGGFAAMSISALVALPAAALARRAVASGSADSDSDSDSGAVHSGSGSGSGGESGGSRLTAPALAAATSASPHGAGRARGSQPAVAHTLALPAGGYQHGWRGGIRGQSRHALRDGWQSGHARR